MILMRYQSFTCPCQVIPFGSLLLYLHIIYCNMIRFLNTIPYFIPVPLPYISCFCCSIWAPNNYLCRTGKKIWNIYYIWLYSKLGFNMPSQYNSTSRQVVHLHTNLLSTQYIHTYIYIYIHIYIHIHLHIHTHYIYIVWTHASIKPCLLIFP